MTSVQRGTPTLTRRFGTGVLWNTVAVAFNQGSTFAANLILANLLGRAGYGGYALVLGTVQAFAQLASLGMGSTATRFLAEYRVNHSSRAESVLGFTLTVAIGCALISGSALALAGGQIAEHLLKTPQLANLLRFAGVAVVFFLLNTYLMGALAGMERFESLGRTNAIAGVLYMVVSVLGGWFYGLNGAVAGLGISAATQTLLLWIAFRRALRESGLTPRASGYAENKDIVVGWVVPGFLGGFTSIAALWGVQALLTRGSGGLPAVALYGAAYNLMTIVLFLPNVANSVGMTLLNNLLGARDADQYRAFYWHNMKATLAVVGVGAIVVAMLGPFLLRAYGKSFEVGYPALLWLLAAAIPESLTIAANQVVLAHRKIWTGIFAINLPRDVVLLGAAALLIPRYGVVGATMAYFVGRVVGFAATSGLASLLGLHLPTSTAPQIDGSLA